MKLVHNIPCFFCDPIFLEGIQGTLQQIQNRCPKDFRRLQGLVREIRPYDDADEGSMGIWVEDFPTADDPATWHYGTGDTPGIVKLNENMPSDTLPAMLAHELGHAATRLEDLWRRGAIDDEWKSELAADWYAYKWGFGRQIARTRKTRDWRHHGPCPGTVFEVSFGGTVYHYRLTRNFVAHLTNTTTSE